MWRDMYHLIELNCVVLLVSASQKHLMGVPAQVVYASFMSLVSELYSLKHYQQFVCPT